MMGTFLFRGVGTLILLLPSETTTLETTFLTNFYLSMLFSKTVSTGSIVLGEMTPLVTDYRGPVSIYRRGVGGGGFGAKQGEI